MDNDLNTGSEVQGRIFHTTAYGDNAAEIEIAALAKAQEFFGHGVTLEVVQDYMVSGTTPGYAAKADGKKYAAGVNIRAGVQK